MSNLPEGVSPSSPHVAGAEEREVLEHVECLAEGACHACGGSGRVGMWPCPACAAGRCPFDGEVTITETILGNGMMLREWTCPRCDTNHEDEEEMQTEPSPDDLRDRMREDFE